MRYRFHQATYVNNVLFDGGPESPAVEVAGDHVPGPHWEPMDEEAKAQAAKHSVKFTGHMPDIVPALTAKLEAAQAAQAQAGNPEAIAKAMVQALMEAGVLQGGKKATAKGDIV